MSEPVGVRNYEAEVKDLHYKLIEMSTQIDGLKAKNEKLNQEINNLNAENKALEHSRDELYHDLQYQKGLTDAYKFCIEQSKRYPCTGC